MTFDTIERAIEEIAAGRAVVVVDDEDRENEGDLIAAASQSDARTRRFHGAPHQWGAVRTDEERRPSTVSACRR